MLTSLARATVTVALLPSRSTGFSTLQMSSSFMGASGGEALSVLGRPLQSCSMPGGPTTGWRRDGFCTTDDRDRGQHCVCSEVTEEFLEYTKAQGNDLSSPRHPYFPGLNPGDRWCLCSSRWLEAQRAGKAPLVVLEATHVKALDVIPFELLMEHSSSDSAGAATAMSGSGDPEVPVEAEVPPKSEL